MTGRFPAAHRVGNMVMIERKTANGMVSGSVDSKFSGVADAFIENFEKRGEVGASVALTLEGRTVVDLWGGRKAIDGESWERNTVCVVFSCTKGASAFCAHMAADRGVLDLDAKVATVW